MKKISLIFIAIAILLAGCTPNSVNGTQATDTGQGYSFNDPDIIAYVDGEPISGTLMSTYIIMKKAYTKAYAEYFEGYSFNGDLSNFNIRWEEELIKETLLYSEDDWAKDYYKSAFLSTRFHETVNNAHEKFEEIADSEVQNIIDREKNKGNVQIAIQSSSDLEGFLESGDISDTWEVIDEYVVDDGSFSAVPAVQSAADELGISFEECSNNVYRPFCITKSIYGHLLNTFYDGLDYGEKVEYNDANESEYEAFVLEYEAYVSKVTKINIDYLDSLFEQAEIVERRP